MDINQTVTELQKFADANNLNINVSDIVNNMDAGDFINLNAAIDNSDNNSIIEILQKYKARFSENYKYFNTDIVIENTELNEINNLSTEYIFKNYYNRFKYEPLNLTLSEMKTLIYDSLIEDVSSISPELKANQIVKRNELANKQSINPQTQASLKQADLQRNANNPSMKVTVPSTQNGTQNVAPVVGVDPGTTPQQTLVVTKDPKNQNQLSVYSLDDVDPVNQNGQVQVQEEYTPAEINQEVMAPPGTDYPTGGPSPLTNTAQGIGELIHAIADIDAEDNVYGDESPLGNTSIEKENDIINDIIDRCHRIRSR